MNLDKNRVLNAPYVIWHTAGEDACDWATSPVRNKRAHQHTTLVMKHRQTMCQDGPVKSPTATMTPVLKSSFGVVKSLISSKNVQSMFNYKQHQLNLQAIV